MRTFWRLAALLACGAALTLPLRAAEGENAEEPEKEPEVTVVVTAERAALPVSQSIATATVITAKEMRERGAVNAADAIRLVPGITLRQSGTLGALGEATIRGTNPNQVLVLMDGQRMSSPAFLGGTDLSKFPVEEIERIEIIRGPVSSLYGSEALGGVVNIITRRPTEAGGNLALGYGARGRRVSALSVHDATNGMAWQLSGTFPGFDGIRQNSDYAASNVAAKVTLPSVGGWELTLRGESYQDKLGLPGPTIDPDADDRQWWDRQTISVGAARALGEGRLEVRAYRVRQRLENPFPGEADWSTFPPGVADFNSIFTGASNIAEVEYSRALGAHRVIAGAEYRDEGYRDQEFKDGAPTGTQTENLNTRALYVQDRWGLDSATDIVLGVRCDDHSMAGSDTTPRVGVTREIASGTRLRASYGEGFRAPNFVELFYTSPFFNGNPDLRPERSRQYEVGMNLQRGANVVDLALFRNNIQDLIQVNAAYDSYDNVGRARQQGAELTWERRLASVARASLSYTYLDAKNLITGARLIRLPRNHLSLTVARVVRAWDVALTGRWTDDRQDLLFDPTTYATTAVTVRGRAVLDLSLASRRGPVNPYITVRNLTNAASQDVAGYPAEGRSVEAGVRTTW